ncbi:MAG: HlyD family efflux transporter periplasmic adaptor subunit [Candidatus Peribacteraceae bacterium]|nr:HlyD family efflux transporter periplasmic adaptor subunit [Candidatus Peribacteraceae bacterium]
MDTPSTITVSPAPVTWMGRIKSFIRTISLWNFSAGLATSLILGGGYLYYAGSASGTEATVNFSMVERRSIVTAVKAVGKVTFASAQEMRFNIKGTVTKVNVRQGDTVKKGDVIAELDKTSVMADLRQAELAIGASNLQLQQLRSSKEKSVQDAQSTLDVQKPKLPSGLAAAERAVAEKQTALDQATLDLKKQKDTELQSLAGTTQDILVGSEKLLDSTYSVVTRNTGSRPLLTQNTPTLTIDHLLYNDMNAANAVEFAYLKAVAIAQQMRKQYGSLGTQRDPAILLRALSDAHALALATSDLSEKTYTMLQGATTDVHNFSAGDLNTLRNTVNTNRGTATDLIAQADTAQANLQALSAGNGIPSITLKQKQDAVTTAQNALKLAQENLAVVETQTPGDLTSAEQALRDTQSSTDINILLKQNSISQGLTALQKSRKTLDDYRLVAPFDGVIRHIDYKVGDNLLDTGDTEYLTIENPTTVVVTIPLDQVDVIKVRVGLPATVIFDAVPGQTFQGTISEIDPTPITTSGVVSYNVEVSLPSPEGLTILSGMTTTVTVETSRKDNVLAIPSLAIRYVGGRATAQKPDGTTVSVSTGITDGRYTEIVTGLEEGDTVTSVNLANTGTSSSANPQQLFRLGGGAPPGGR